MLRQAIGVLRHVDTAKGCCDRDEQPPARQVVGDVDLIQQSLGDYPSHTVPDDDESVDIMPLEKFLQPSSELARGVAERHSGWIDEIQRLISCPLQHRDE